MKVELPSGLSGELRKLKGVDIIALAERAEGNARSIGSAISPCWVRTDDPGPYPWIIEGQAGLDWDRLLKGDLVAALLKLRSFSLPNGWFYDFAVQCEACRKRYQWRVDLERELEIKSMTPANREIVRAGNRFRTTIERTTDDGEKKIHAVTFKLQTSKDDDALIKLMKQLERKTKTPVEELAVSIVKLDELTDTRAIHREIQQFDIGALGALDAAIEDVNCGVETAILTTCDKGDCKWQQETALPFGRRFLSPTTRGNPIPEGYTRPELSNGSEVTSERSDKSSEA